MVQQEDMSSLFPVFILSILALIAVPWTIHACSTALVARKAKNLTCSCSLCRKSPKNQPSFSERVFGFLSFTNISLVIIWITMAFLLYHISLITKEIQPFEPFSILGLEVGASDSQIKKAYYKLSRQYHPDKNPDPAATKYFVDFISKAYEALTNEVARKNLEEYGHPDGRQAVNVGIALPKFMLDIQGPQGGILLLCLVGVGILLPLIIVVIYLSRSSKFTGNNIMHQTLVNYYHLIKPSLAPSKVMDALLKSAEFIEMPVRRSEEEPLLKLFTLVRSELNLDPKNLKQETAKFWKRHPALVKAELLLLAHLTGQSQWVPKILQPDLKLMLHLVPRLLEELMKMSVLPRTADQHGWLRPAMGVMELSQCIMQTVPLSARKVSEKAATAGTTEGIAAFLQLPHFTESVVKKLNRKKLRSLQELRDMPSEERVDLLTSLAGLSPREASDVDCVLKMMPTLSLDIVCETEGEDGIQEGDVVTFKAWVSLSRPSGLRAAYPHCPNFPEQKEEHYWLLLADVAQNAVWVSQRVSFLDEGTAVSAAAKVVRETAEGEGKSDEEVNAAVKEAVEKVKGGARLVVTKFQAPAEGVYHLTAMCMSDVWIGCDKKSQIKLKTEKRSRAGTRVSGLVTTTEDVSLQGDNSDIEEEEEDVIDEDYESEYSEDEKESEEIVKQADGEKNIRGAGDAEESESS